MNPDALAAVLAGTLLGGREVVSADLPGTTGRAALLVRIDPVEVLGAWQVARNLVSTTGRWPVATCAWGPDEPGLGGLRNVFDRFSFDVDAGSETSPAEVLDAAGSADVDGWLHNAEVQRAEFGVPVEFRSEDGPPAGQTLDIAYLDWFEPVGQPTAICLLPTDDGAATLAHMHWFAASSGAGSAVMVALLRRWKERWGAELVAHWGTMLQFVVHRPPTTIDEARDLAREQLLAAPCTVELSGVAPESHARALVGLDRWFLHERP